ncbi:MAG: urease accessory protein UreD [Paracoccaceae bacterium]
MALAPMGRTHITDLRQSGSTKLVFPRQFTPDLEAILVNTAGGITGGDRFDLDLSLDTGSTLTLTTQAAERAYRAQPHEIADVTSRAHVASGALLKWLPQELILFEQSALRRRLHIDLDRGARLLMSEAVVFGRAAMHETLRDISFRDSITVQRAGRPIFIDGVSLQGDATAHLARRAIANGAGAMASVVLVDPDAESRLTQLRATLPDCAGVSLLAPDLLAIRLLARDSFELRAALIPALEFLSQTALPTSWRL